MNLRPALTGDVETLFDIRCSVVENYQSREELTNLGITTQSIQEMIEGGDYITTIAEENGQPAGFAMAQISEGYIFACFVKPEFENKGLGRALMHSVEEGMHTAGVKKAWLSTGPESELRAVGFYSHLGWYKDGYLEDGQVVFRKTLIDSEHET